MVDLTGLAFAFTAGMLSIFSPCGYALLPGYVSYYLGSDLSLVRAVVGGLACTLGLVTVFSVVGALASSLGALMPQLIPLLDILAAVILMVFGVAMLRQTNIPYLQLNVRPTTRRGLAGLYMFGLVYGIAGVGCSAPVFLSVLFFAVSESWINGVLTFTVYAFGMGVPLVITSVLVAEAKDILIRRISGATERLHKLGGTVLILVGLYLFYTYYVTYFPT
ncbi:MAG: cytochrome c biogenesis protein CcdA [Candidatus Bathyarchaeota archaeon]|nr:MAG: cytochrome c biogenesis protein CcdA [Candidatus Bathyarchaeota archaeon]